VICINDFIDGSSILYSLQFVFKCGVFSTVARNNMRFIMRAAFNRLKPLTLHYLTGQYVMEYYCLRLRGDSDFIFSVWSLTGCK
jgi:hypothetical protein